MKIYGPWTNNKEGLDVKKFRPTLDPTGKDWAGIATRSWDRKSFVVLVGDEYKRGYHSIEDAMKQTDDYLIHHGHKLINNRKEFEKYLALL